MITNKEKNNLLRKISCEKTFFDIPILKKQTIDLNDISLISFKIVFAIYFVIL
jgi:hypothetical protein